MTLMELADPTTFFKNRVRQTAAEIIGSSYTPKVPTTPRNEPSIEPVEVQIHTVAIPAPQTDETSSTKSSPSTAAKDLPKTSHLEEAPEMPQPNQKHSSAIYPASRDGKDMNIALRVVAIEHECHEHQERITALEKIVKVLELAADQLKIAELSPPVSDRDVNEAKGGAKEVGASLFKNGSDEETAAFIKEKLSEKWDFTGISIATPLDLLAANPKPQQPYKAKFTPTWRPSVVRNFAPLKDLALEMQPLPMEKLKPFSVSFLKTFLGSTEFANGMYYPAKGAKEHQMAKMMPSKSYYMIDVAVDPFAPRNPGEHGAKLAVVMRPLAENKMVKNVPVFVTLPGEEDGEKKYYYMGHYTQSRWSDRLDYDRMQEVVPEGVKQHWAIKLAKKDSPEWQVAELGRLMVTKPTYDGIVPRGPGVSGDGPDEKTQENFKVAKEDMEAYFGDIKDWEDEVEETMDTLTKIGVMEAFERADEDALPGLRFWWEYLECRGFQRNFYYLLSQAQSAMECGLMKEGWKGTTA